MRRLLLILPLILAACSAPPPTSADPSLFLRGTATVISVDPTSGSALLNVNGQRISAYWQTENVYPQGGFVVHPDINQPPVGQYQDPDVRLQAFNAKPGDTIRFLGLRTGNSLFLQSIAVVPN